MADIESKAHVEDNEKETDSKSEDVNATGSGHSSYEGLDLHSYHERNAGRLVVDPEEARIEFGEEVAKRLKLSADGSKVLWPQPTDDPEDPQTWSDARKNFQLFIITLAAVVPDFDSGIGIASIFALATQYDTTPGRINNLTSNWSIFLLGFGSPFAVVLVRRYGRLPVLFWSQVLAVGFLVGCTFAPNIKVFTAMRCLTAFFGTCPQVIGLYVVTDMFPFHLQARKLNVWTMGFIIAPFLSPFAFGFLVARASWRWTYGIGSLYGAVVVFFVTFFMEETLYDRTLRNPHPVPRPASRVLYRVQTLIGITGARMARFRTPWRAILYSPFEIIWRPQLASILLFEASVFGFGIGINVTNAVFLSLPPPNGYGFGQYAIAGAYGTPIVSVIIGEILGHYFNDWVQNVCIRRNKGVFEAEMRLWCDVLHRRAAVRMWFVLLGAAFQKNLSVAALVLGWGITEVAIMINTVAVYAYCHDCFPGRQGEISALINVTRTLGGFSVAYFQVPWATKHGALQTFGVEAAIVAVLFLLTVPALQRKGAKLRERFSV
ncbi:MFS general substrate transporter [Amylocystis lapponica]|nr:MFS general substrate transporter [Amylocystis lapponica]